MARIPYPEHSAPAVDKLPTPLNAFRMLSHAPDLPGPAIDLAMAVLGSSLPVRLRELAVMAVAARTDCAYGLVQHRPIALDAGVTADQLAAIVELRAEEGEFDEVEWTLLTATEELLARHTLAEATLGALRKHFTDRQVVELITTVGYFTMLAGLLNGLDVDIDPAGEQHFGPSRRQNP
ncbi:carboxymuconolactone decarboxylase family protein [Streptomyces sp. NPDC088350]|uniref:carboxymuconolactone decarboxylase family protein n=1 Tax=Streptomyces sp. NPDC088350 TaxID=3365854 RepID=UPI00380D2FBA